GAAIAPGDAGRLAPGDAGYIGSRRFDRLFFFGSAALAGALGIAALAAPAIVIPLWWLFLLLVDGPHLAATWTRSHLAPPDGRRLGPLLASSLLFLVPGPIAWAAGKATQSRIP